MKWIKLSILFVVDEINLIFENYHNLNYRERAKIRNLSLREQGLFRIDIKYALMDNSNIPILILKKGDQIIGWACFIILKDWEAPVFQFYVRKKYRREKLGFLFFEKIINFTNTYSFYVSYDEYTEHFFQYCFKNSQYRDQIQCFCRWTGEQVN